MEEHDIKKIVKAVIAEISDIEGKSRQTSGLNGVFDNIDDAISAAKKAKKLLGEYTIEQRERMIANIRKLTLSEAGKLAELAVADTGMGRVDHKIMKNRLVAEKTPGTEDLHPVAMTGDAGLTLVEPAPFGVIGSITPSTNPSETIICNSIGMIAAGNGVVFSPHPGAAEISNYTVDLINRAVLEAGGPEFLVTSQAKPTIEATEKLIASEDINMLVATGGPGIVKKLLSSGKKAIGAGAGNPPVVVDETADIKKAARDITAGAGFDNNMPCIAEKECFAVAEIYEELIFHMKQCGCYELDPQQTEQVLRLVMVNKNGKMGIDKKWVGKDAAKILSEIGVRDTHGVDLLICRTEEEHPFVVHELMMPILPIVKCGDVNRAIDMAVKAEHSNRHSAHMHSKNVDNLTKMAKKAETTIFVKNAPSYAGIGAGGEGYTTFTIAGPTGEGLTSAKTFTRQRRCVLVDGFHII